MEIIIVVLLIAALVLYHKPATINMITAVLENFHMKWDARSYMLSYAKVLPMIGMFFLVSACTGSTFKMATPAS